MVLPGIPRRKDMNSPNQTQPKWGAKHDAIIARYEQRVKDGSVKEFVIIPRDKE